MGTNPQPDNTVAYALVAFILVGGAAIYIGWLLFCFKEITTGIARGIETRYNDWRGR